MPYLVDGNNVMAQRVGWHRDKAGARRGLLGELARYVKKTGVRLSVVFDGAPDEHFPDGSSFMGVGVFYAARGSDADERIKRMVDEERERRTLVVVTSDRALADYVRRSGARVVRAGEFRRRMEEAEEGSKDVKEALRGSEDVSSRDKKSKGEMSDEELRREMRYFGVEPEDE